MEGCYCKDGYVLNKKSQCIKVDECPRTCTASENNCGVGAICTFSENKAICQCVAPATGDPNTRCCGKNK